MSATASSATRAIDLISLISDPTWGAQMLREISAGIDSGLVAARTLSELAQAR